MCDQKTCIPKDIYEIKIGGNLDPKWEEWFDGVKIQPLPGDETLLLGRILDQAALHGLLAKIRDLGLSLLSVNKVEDSRDCG
jgi:hypothetical protein